MTDTTLNYSPNFQTLSKVSNPNATDSLKHASSQTQNVTPETSVASPLAKADQASLSAASGLIAKALSHSTSDVRADKVASLQKAISSGTYNVSSSDVAEKLLKSLLG